MVHPLGTVHRATVNIRPDPHPHPRLTPVPTPGLPNSLGQRISRLWFFFLFLFVCLSPKSKPVGGGGCDICNSPCPSPSHFLSWCFLHGTVSLQPDNNYSQNKGTWVMGTKRHCDCLCVVCNQPFIQSQAKITQ